jgi:hypothetical protein
MKNKKLVYIACPVRGDVALNAAYRRACHRHAITIGENPLPWSGWLELYEDPSDEEGMSLYKQWVLAADATLVVYVDLGVSRGMQEEIAFFEANMKPIIRRTLQ